MALVALATAGVIATVAVAVAGLSEQPTPKSPAPPAAEYAPALQRATPPLSKPVPSWDWFALPYLNTRIPNSSDHPLLGERADNNSQDHTIAHWESLPMTSFALRLQ